MGQLTKTSVTTPVLQLKGFLRVELKAGESTVVTFDPVNVEEELRILNRDFQWAVEGGQVEVSVGGASDDLPLKGAFEILAST